jgi:predicted acetyltransferase
MVDIIFITACKIKREPLMVSLEYAENRLLIANLFNYYVYDMSEFMGWQPAKSGLYVEDPEQIEIHEYWQWPDHFPYLIRFNDEVAGFALIRFLTKENCFDVGQFFILRKFKGKHIGHKALEEVFQKHPGRWQVRVLVENIGARAFWESVLPKLADSEVKSTVDSDEEDVMYFYRFTA